MYKFEVFSHIYWFFQKNEDFSFKQMSIDDELGELDDDSELNLEKSIGFEDPENDDNS